MNPEFRTGGEGSPEAFFGQVLTMFATWVADQEIKATKFADPGKTLLGRRQERLLFGT